MLTETVGYDGAAEFLFKEKIKEQMPANDHIGPNGKLHINLSLCRICGHRITLTSTLPPSRMRGQMAYVSHALLCCLRRVQGEMKFLYFRENEKHH